MILSSSEFKYMKIIYVNYVSRNEYETIFAVMHIT